MLKLEEVEEPRNGRLHRNSLGFFKDETKRWIKALVTVESLSRVVVDLIKFWIVFSNIYDLGYKISWNHIFPTAWSSTSLVFSPVLDAHGVSSCWHG